MGFKIGDVVMRLDGDKRPHKIVDITVHEPLNYHESTFFVYHYEDGGSDISDCQYLKYYDGKYKNKILKVSDTELKDYTTEQLKDELKRRADEKRAQKTEEMKTALRCGNCKYCMPNPNVPSWCRGNYYICNVRTWGKKIVRNYCVKPSTKACDKFERKED